MLILGFIGFPCLFDFVTMHAFILAGGFATRLWPLTESRPKPLLPLAGKPILTHLIEKIPKDIPITVSTNAVFADAFHQWQSQVAKRQLPIRILIEDARHDDHEEAIVPTGQVIPHQGGTKCRENDENHQSAKREAKTGATRFGSRAEHEKAHSTGMRKNRIDRSA